MFTFWRDNHTCHVNDEDVENEGFTYSYTFCEEITPQLSTYDFNFFKFFSPSDPCSAGEGDCEVDADCKGTLRCGYNNCGDNDPTGVTDFDGFSLVHC